MNFKNINKDFENNMRYRFNKRYNHINEFVEEQKEIRSNLIKNKKKEREEKEERNIILKNLNEDAKREKEKRLLEQFEINEENVRRRINVLMKPNDKRCENCIWFTKYDNDPLGYCRALQTRVYYLSLTCHQFADREEVWQYITNCK